jgi:hypothetical protein
VSGENPEKPEATKVTLHAFIEENHKILSVLGVFTALTVFARGLPLTGMGQVLSFFFLTLTVLLWIEIMTRYPKPASTRLIWFENIVTATVFLTAGYWLVEYYAILGTAGIALLIMWGVAFTVIWLVSLPIKALFRSIERSTLPAWTRGKPVRWTLFVLVIACVGAFSLTLGFMLGNRSAPSASRLIESMRTEFAKRARTEQGATQVKRPTLARSPSDSSHIAKSDSGKKAH